MTDICHFANKKKLTHSEAIAQAKNSKRPVTANKCRVCGFWHANSPNMKWSKERRKKGGSSKIDYIEEEE